MGGLREDLAGPGVEIEETHISLVFLARDEVHKVKKAVSLGFLDFSTLKDRERACRAEVELNRRFSPEAYLGVVPVVRDATGRHRLADDQRTAAGEQVVDWAVHMRRLPEERRADRLLAAGELGEAELRRVAETLARFHAAARSDEATAAHATADAVARNVEENFAQLGTRLERYLTAAEATELADGQRRFVTAHRELFDRRSREGRSRDGHGDLRLEHVYLDVPGLAEGVTVLDCIEFDERFRYGDVAADVAFLAMDLAHCGRADLAESFLAAYAAASGDYDLYRVVDFYQSYRATVRAKIAALLAAGPELETAARERADGEARRHLLLALACERRPFLPAGLVAVGGVIGSGKSTVAGAIAAATSAPVVEADRARKQLVGVAPETPLRVAAWSGPYDEATTDGVYRELARSADAVLASGRPVVVDASFRRRSDRLALRRLAAERRVPFLFLECRASRAEIRRRLERRERTTGVSDGRREILDDFVARYEPVDELPPGEHRVVDTERSRNELVSELTREMAGTVTAWPAGLTG